MNTNIDVKGVISFVRACGPVTATEAQFAFSYPTEEFAATVLQEIEDVTHAIISVGDYWTALSGRPTHG